MLAAGRLTPLAAALLLGAAVPVRAQKVDAVQRGTFKVLVRARGTVAAEDVFRLKSTIEGRVEAVRYSSNTWADGRTPLGFLANTELAALVDARGTTAREVLEERWQRVFAPTPIRCPGECFVLKVFARPKLWVRPEAVLFEAASRLRLRGWVRTGDAHWIQEGQLIRYWPRADVKRKQEGRVEKAVLDAGGQKEFTTLLSPDHYLDPGTEWEGLVLVLVHKNVLSVPTSALLFQDGQVFLPVRVSTGITTYDFTEIAAGASEGQKFLQLLPDVAPPLQKLVPRPPPEPSEPAISVRPGEDVLIPYYRKKPTITVIVPSGSKQRDEDFPSDLE